MIRRLAPLFGLLSYMAALALWPLVMADVSVAILSVLLGYATYDALTNPRFRAEAWREPTIDPTDPYNLDEL